MSDSKAIEQQPLSQLLPGAITHQAEEKYRSIVDNAVCGIFQTTPNGRFIYANRALARMFGYESTEELMANITDIGQQIHVDPNRRAEITRLLEENDTVRGFEAQAYHKDSSIIWILLTARTIRDPDGNVLAYEGMAEDITPLKQTEEQLRTRACQQAAVAEIGLRALSGTDLATLMDEAAALVAQTMDVEYCKILELLPSGNALLLRAGAGWKEGLVGQTIVGAGANSHAGYALLSTTPVIVEDLRTETRFNPPQLLVDHGVISGVSVIIHGRERPWGVLGAHSARKLAFTQEDVNFLQAIANVLATSIERKRTEEEREQLLAQERTAHAEAEMAKRRLGFLADSSALLVGSLDNETTLANIVRLAVPTFADLCMTYLVEEDGQIRWGEVEHINQTKTELVRKLDDLYPLNSYDLFGVAKVLRTGRPEIYTEVDDSVLAAGTHDADHFKLLQALDFKSVMVVPLLARGRTLGAILFAVGESGRRYGLNDLALAEEISRRCGLAIDNARLYSESQRIQAELRKASESKDEFLSLVSHELRTPVTTIYGGSRALRARSERLDEESRTAILADIEQESERLYRMIEDLLVLARIESSQEIATEPLLVQRIVDKAVAAFTQRRSSRKVEVRLEADLEPVVAQPTYLEQVLRNLLSNADKYNPPDSPVEIQVKRSGDNEAMVSVLDRGPGIAPEEADLIFERFYRSDRTSKQAKGMGVGLTVCKRLIEAQSGRIWAQPREGGGLEITFTLPLYKEE